MNGFLESAPELLFDLTIKSLVLVGVLLLLTPIIRRFSAATRSLIWTLTLAAIVVLPVLSVVVPAWQVHVLPPQVFSAANQQDAFFWEPHPAVVTHADRAVVEAVPAPADNLNVNNTAPHIAVEVAEWPAELQSGNTFLEVVSGFSWTMWLVLVWAAGASIVLFRFLSGTLGVWWLQRYTEPVTDPEWLRMAEDIRDRYALRRRVDLVRSTRAIMPLTWGIFRPVVLLSGDADTWTSSRRQCVLMHEYAHIKRWDCLSQLIAQVACAMYWFNPLVWWVNKKMHVDREQACDDYVLASGRTKASEYAFHLLEIASSLPSAFSSPLAGVAMARPSSLEDRIRSILDPERRRRILNRTTISLTVLFAAFAILPVAAIRMWVVPDEQPAVKSEEWNREAYEEEFEYALEHNMPDMEEIKRQVERALEASLGAEEMARIQEEVERALEASLGPDEIERIQEEVQRALEVGLGPDEIARIHEEVERAHAEIERAQEAMMRAHAEIAAEHKIQKTMIDERFAVRPGGHLIIDVADASIQLGKGSSDEMHVEIRITGDDLENAREYFEQFNYRVEKSGNTVSVLSDKPERIWSDDEYQVGIFVHGPAEFNVDLRTIDGHIQMGDLNGQAKVYSVDGNIHTGNVVGPLVEVGTVDGHISAGDLKGRTVTVNSVDGNIHIRDAIGETVRVNTVDGHITVRELSGTIDVSSVDGNLLVSKASGPSINMKTVDGHINTGEIGSNRAELTTGDGNISLSHVAAPLLAETKSGHVNVKLDKPFEVRLRSGEGNILLDLPQGMGADVDLRGRRILMGENNFEGSSEEERATGKINGGGLVVEARTEDGAVTLN